MALKPTGQPVGRPFDYEMNGGDKPNERRASLLVKNLSATSRQGGGRGSDVTGGEGAVVFARRARGATRFRARNSRKRRRRRRQEGRRREGRVGGAGGAPAARTTAVIILTKSERSPARDLHLHTARSLSSRARAECGGGVPQFRGIGVDRGGR